MSAAQHDLFTANQPAHPRLPFDFQPFGSQWLTDVTLRRSVNHLATKTPIKPAAPDESDTAN